VRNGAGTRNVRPETLSTSRTWGPVQGTGVVPATGNRYRKGWWRIGVMNMEIL